MLIILLSKSSNWMILFSIIMILISFFSSQAKKNKNVGKKGGQQSGQYPNYPGRNPQWNGRNHSQYQREQWDQGKIRQQTTVYYNAEQSRDTQYGNGQISYQASDRQYMYGNAYTNEQWAENQYMEEERFRREKYQVQENVADEYFEEYVPEEFGEGDYRAGADNFYHRNEIQNALTDEQDIARKNAYQIKAKGFDQKKSSVVKHRQKNLLRQPGSLKKGIIMMEILGKPKSLQDESR